MSKEKSNEENKVLFDYKQRYFVLRIVMQLLLVAVIIWISALSIVVTAQAVVSPSELPLPEEWQDQGVVLSPSVSGWDSLNHDGFGIQSVIKKEGIYYMYYGGASGPRQSDGRPANRAIGVATSTDGIHFTKYAGNPIVTHQPSAGHPNQQEEGASSPAVSLDSNGYFIMYWDAKTAINNSEIKTDIHLSISSDGFNFTDMGIVILSKLGCDEAIPLGVLHVEGGFPSLSGNWHLWYNTQCFGGRKIALATGDTPFALTQYPNNPVIGDFNWAGDLHPVLLPNGQVSVFIQEGNNKWPNNPVTLRTTATNQLNTYSEPKTYFPNVGSWKSYASIVLPDIESGIWRMYDCGVDTQDGKYSSYKIECRLKTVSLKIKDAMSPVPITDLKDER